MNTTFIIAVAFLTLFVVAFGVATLFVFMHRNKQVKAEMERCTSITTGEVIEEENERYVVGYSIGDSYIEETIHKRKELNIGSRVNVYYNPKDYSEHYVEGNTRLISKGFFISVTITLVVFVVWTWGLVLFMGSV